MCSSGISSIEKSLYSFGADEKLLKPCSFKPLFKKLLISTFKLLEKSEARSFSSSNYLGDSAPGFLFCKLSEKALSELKLSIELGV
jgi:hypothetical protein